MNKFAVALSELQKEIQMFDRSLFEKIKQEEYSPGYTKDGLKRFREKAVNERNLRESYRGRAPYELLQNADDAQAKNAAYILCKEGIAFVHDGKWFTGENFISLADGWSDKDPNVCIGHKGLGFRSVLDITPSPYLVSIDSKDFFAVKFSWGLNQGHIMETIKRKPEYTKDYDKWKSSGQNICPIMYIPGIAKKQNLGEGAVIYDRLIRGEYQNSFTTMFWMPANDDIERRVLEELDPMPITSGSEEQEKLRNFILKDVGTLIPFLRRIESVSLYEDKRRLVSVSKKNPGIDASGKYDVVYEEEGRKRERSVHQLIFRAPIPQNIINAQGTPRAVRVMKEAGIVLSLTLQNGCPVSIPKSKFHVYFPTEESTGFGFVVHGDFFVSPDRKRLMEKNTYNEWLLNFAAGKAAGEFLSALLNHYAPRNIFTALAPTGEEGNSAKYFSQSFADHLKKRRSPFIPHVGGLAQRDEVLVPPLRDSEGFLEGNFTAALPKVSSKKYFVQSSADTFETRKFFSLAGLSEMPAKLILELAENIPSIQDQVSWWYRLFDFMANHAAFSELDKSDFTDRKMILASDGKIYAISGGSGAVLCFPPSGAAESLNVPDCLSDVLLFLNKDLSEKIKAGSNVTESWIVNRLNISKFEANDFIPKAIRTIVENIYDGTVPLTPKQLAHLWAFLKQMTESSKREFTSEDYWREVGRLPLPSSYSHEEQILSPRFMVPAFLMYSPEGLASSSCLEGVEGIRRISKGFFDLLKTETGAPESDQIAFFQKAGVSSKPKILRYSRSAIEEGIPLTVDGLNSLKRAEFCGERQRDENVAVVTALKKDGLWEKYLEYSNLCVKHPEHSQTTLHYLHMMENFVPCCRQAVAEYDAGHNNWKERLWSLLNGLDTEVNRPADRGYCGSFSQKNRHDFILDTYLSRQLEDIPWVPTTGRPSLKSSCFSRFAETRLISKRRSEDELGDLIIPYIIVSDHSEMAKLETLGIKSLYNVDGSDPETLCKALGVIGEKLDSDWGRKEIVCERGRWRRVRGAIQEIYRKLNQAADYVIPENIKIVAKTGTGISFISGPMFYARPGSATEGAFTGVLPLIDIDRPQKELFEKLSVMQLIAGETVLEELVDRELSVPVPQLKDIIVNELSPYLLAVNYDKGEKEVDRFVRRLKERFEVFSSSSLTVSVSLIGNPSQGGKIPFRNFYLAKKSIPISGAAEEYHFSLFVEGEANISFNELDADALGEVLTQLFMDRVTEEALGYFPRITSRFQQCRIKGDLKQMQEYLHLQLGIPRENQENVVSLMSGETDPVQAEVIPPPPKPKIIVYKDVSAQVSSDKSDEIKKRHQMDSAEKTTSMLNQILRGDPSKGDSKKKAEPPTKFEVTRVTSEQKTRGLKGELEIKRRLMAEGGWEGFLLLRDTRQENCGYDFLCLKEGIEVKVELKTFTENGYMSITKKELIQSRLSKEKYFLIGLLDNGKEESEWKSFVAQNPFNAVTEYGEFEFETRLQVDPSDIFKIHEEMGTLKEEAESALD